MAPVMHSLSGNEMPPFCPTPRQWHNSCEAIQFSRSVVPFVPILLAAQHALPGHHRWEPGAAKHDLVQILTIPLSMEAANGQMSANLLSVLAVGTGSTGHTGQHTMTMHGTGAAPIDRFDVTGPTRIICMLAVSRLIE